MHVRPNLTTLGNPDNLIIKQLTELIPSNNLCESILII